MEAGYVRLTVLRDDGTPYRIWKPTDVRIASIACIREKPVRRDPLMGYEDGAEIDVVGMGTLVVLEDPIRIKGAIAWGKSELNGA